MLVGDDIEGNEDDDGEENWGSVGEDVAEDVGDEEVGDVENSEEDGDEVRQTIVYMYTADIWNRQLNITRVTWKWKNQFDVS